jgi:enamine deaminase RidA (YjgF/YER057c/UK114 family)
MKKIALGFGLLFLFSCKKLKIGAGNPFEDPKVLGTITPFSVNQKSWPYSNYTLRTYALSNKACTSKYSIFIVHDAQETPKYTEELIFKELPYGKIGRFPLKFHNFQVPFNCDSLGSYYADFWLNDDDVVFGSYGIAKNSESYVEIESFNTQTKEVKGNFKLTLAVSGRSSDYPNYYYPDTLRLSGGKFTLPVVNFTK